MSVGKYRIMQDIGESAMQGWRGRTL
jgi:hypothetical protein